jgi:hypothetical protein
LERMVNRTSEKVGEHIIPFIEGMPLKGVYGVPNVKNNELIFKLSRNPDANLTWNSVLRRPSLFIGHKDVLISVGYENEERGVPTISKEKNFTLVIVKAFSFWICVLIILVLLVILFWLAKSTEMLKEPFAIGENGHKRPYSLALTQMTFWYFLVVSAMIILFLITKEFPDVNSTVLILIGISSLTALSSEAINYNKLSEVKKKLVSLKAEKKTLSNRITEIKDKLKQESELEPSEKLELEKEKKDSEIKLYEIIQSIPQYNASNKVYFSKGFLRDLVSDATGVSLHRFQIAVWTLLFGFYFCYSVWNDLKMPELDPTYLALMGISSGTYIGFKIPEQKS